MSEWQSFDLEQPSDELIRWWSDWATGNTAGGSTFIAYVPRPVVELVGIEQPGYGLVNLRLGFHLSGKLRGYTSWLTGVTTGNVRSVHLNDFNPANGAGFRVEAGHGIVDAYLLDGIEASPRLTGNPNGDDVNLSLSGRKIAGMQCRIQDGYGLVDARLFSLP